MEKEFFWKKPFFILCFFEFFERFAFYGFTYISLAFYMHKLGISESAATTLMGGFAALTYAFNALGGYAADRFIGIKRAMYAGASLLAIGYGLLAFLNSSNSTLLYLALAFIIAGSCLFKPAPTNLIAQIYGENPQALDITFTYFYMSINLGSFCAAWLIPALQKNQGDFAALATCSLGLMLGIFYSLYQYKNIKKFDNKIGHLKCSPPKLFKTLAAVFIGIALVTWLLSDDYIINWVLGSSTLFIFLYFIFQTIKNPNAASKRKMIVTLLMLIYGTAFFVIYQQKNTSFLLFNIHHVNLSILGYKINPQTVPGFLNTLGIIFLSPILAKIYTFMGKKDLSLPYKFSLGLLFSSVAYGVLWFACLLSDSSEKISFLWEFLSISIFFSGGELLVSALGLSLVSKLVPPHLRGFSMGMWFITSALGIKLGSYIASLAANKHITQANAILSGEEQIKSLHNYQELFGSLFFYGIVLSFFAFLFGKKLTKMISES